MSRTDPELARVIDRVRSARAGHAPLYITGGGTKIFYGEQPVGESLDVTGVKGISCYEPTELVVTVRAGTALEELESALEEHGQCLPFEPPRFAPGGTVGGMVAAGLSGPARANVGAVRDHVLGVTLLNGLGEVLSFGGASGEKRRGLRCFTADGGILGRTRSHLRGVAQGAARRPRHGDVVLRLGRGTAHFGNCAIGTRQPLPLNASAWCEGRLHVRLGGAAAAVDAACARLGGTPLAPDAAARLVAEAYAIRPGSSFRSMRECSPAANVCGACPFAEYGPGPIAGATIH